MKKRFVRLVSALLIAVLLLGLAACGSNPTTAPASETSNTATGNGLGDYAFVFGSVGNESESGFRAAQLLMDYLEKNTDGHISTQGFPNSALGGDREMVEAVQMGQQTMVASSFGNVANFLPELSSMDLPFAFSDRASVEALFADEEFYQFLKDELASVGFYLAGITFQGFRTLTSNKKVECLADMKGLNIRVMENPTPIALWTAFGANPTPIAYTEVYTALQQGVVDAQENPISLISSAKFYEQQKYIINTNHQIQAIFWLADLSWYNSLPDEYKKVFDDGCKELVAYHNTECDAEQAEFLQNFIDSGCEYIELTAEAREEIKQTAMTIWPMLQESNPDFYAKYVEALERSQKN